MSLSRISSRFPKTVFARGRCTLPIDTRVRDHPLHITSGRFHHTRHIQNKAVSDQRHWLDHSAHSLSALQRFRFSSSSSSETTEKGNSQSGDGGTTKENNGTTAEASVNSEVPEQSETSSSDDEHESENELTIEDLVKLVAEKEEQIKLYDKEKEDMLDKVVRTYAEMENVKGRTRREAENSKKFAIQSFAKSLLDVADNLGRASSVVKESFSKIDTSTDTSSAAVPLLKTLLEGVEMTEKQLGEVFKKYGMEKYDPTNEQFDPNRHNAVFQVPDASKPAGTVAVVLKAGYTLHDRVIRPAEVGVAVEVEDDAAK